MTLFKLAFKNLLGAGIRTWLNVVVLSLSFVVIIWMQGLYKGMNNQAVTSTIDVIYAGGQYWQESYDPYDPLTLQDAHGVLPDELKSLIKKEEATALLIIQGTAYPQGRMMNLLIKGIAPDQKIISIPSHFLDKETKDIPAVIGTRMSESTGLKKGDTVTLRWRDANGTFDARDATIVQVMRTTVQTIDQGQIWVPLERLRELSRMEGEATLVIVDKDIANPSKTEGWEFKSLDFLLQDIKQLVQTKTAGASIFYVILLLLAMLAIFNTQVLSIFRRRKEIGTLMAIGFTRAKVIWLFTIEGAMHAVLAALVAALYGIPFLTWFSKTGWSLPESVDSYGFAIGEKLFPVYSAGLVIGTTVLVLVVTTIVSFIPTRKIAKLKPTDALRGKSS
ncbi:MAG: FtsX-like permease family protein [Candidatus Aminicenantes bacterium]|nr:FtsX-like permease family protein [Candidatus Aminicenantes bacterium]